MRYYDTAVTLILPQLLLVLQLLLLLDLLLCRLEF
jgi:hypothetical protein